MTGNSDSLPLEFGWNEWTGALGDMGTFAPLFISLVAFCGLPPARSLMLTGAVYIAGALYFRLPMPVQPLKAMAAIAIAQHLGMPVLWAGAVWMGLILLCLTFTGGLDRLSRIFTPVVVKGIQLGVGLMLIKAGIQLLGNPRGALSTLTGSKSPEFSLSVFMSALWILVIPQLPMTLGNAVFAVSDVAGNYFGRFAKRASYRNLAVSLGASNLIMGFCGGLPVCHGSGGLTAHFRFGARTAGSTILTGMLFIAAAGAFGGHPERLFSSIPPAVLAGMVLYVGACHVLLIRGLEKKRSLALLMGLIGLATQNLSYALLAGVCLENSGLFPGGKPVEEFPDPAGVGSDVALAHARD